MPVAVMLPTVWFDAPLREADVPYRNPTDTVAAVPRPVRSPFKVPPVVVMPDAAVVVTVGAAADVDVVKLRMEPVAKPSPRAHAWK